MAIRIVTIFIAPFILAWTFVSVLWREVRSAPWYAWNACAQEIASMRRAWRSKSMNPEDWKR
jgi:hypothetical protein